jgi:divalent metal cation (Fe/Co/Zn/Cd) transporter
MLAVLGALIANGLITILKFIGALMTGSAGLMAESLHSLADTTNQVFLLLGEAANAKSVASIQQSINDHPNVVETVELLTTHLAPKQILVTRTST